MRIKILDTIWDIYFIPSDCEIFSMPNGNFTVGVTDLDSMTIYIADNLNKEFEREVLLHELCHAMTSVLDIDVSDDDEECHCMWYGKQA